MPRLDSSTTGIFPMNLATRCSYLTLSCTDQFAPITRGNRSHIISVMKAADAGLLFVQIVGAGHNA